MITLNSVVLPAPFGPMTPMMPPSCGRPPEREPRQQRTIKDALPADQQHEDEEHAEGRQPPVGEEPQPFGQHDQEAGAQNWHFVGPYKKMTFASRMQHKIYWGPLKKPIEWSLKTVLAPWAYIASVVYHDSFWYPVKAKALMSRVLNSPWGRLFRSWERVKADERGYPQIPEDGAEIRRTGVLALRKSLNILATFVREAPEFASKRPHQPATT